MAGFTLHTSNRLEILAESLIEFLGQSSPSPFRKQTVLVQSKGMERWISMQVAARLGVCANVEFPFPNAFIHRIFSSLADEQAPPWATDREVMTWKIMGLLPGCMGRPGFGVIEQYLNRDGSQLRRFQLSCRIVMLFDQYLVFRPQMILNWEEGQEDHWQAQLWRELTRGETVHHAARLKEIFHTACADPQFRLDLSQVPDRLAVFGISTLPPFHMEVLADLARFADIDFFLLNPCREYWADIRSEREMGRMARRSVERPSNLQHLHLEEGHPLLASLGGLGRDFFDLARMFASEEIDSFTAPGRDSLLHCLQTDILELPDREPGDRLTVQSSDCSIAIHSCHSPMREIEVLHDQLLAMFEADPTLEPRDVLVMTPDIHLYAPVIQAVFETPEDPETRIPFTIADRTLRRQSRVIDAFLSILELPGSRFTSGQVLSVLDQDPVRRRFGLSPTDLDLVRQWVKETRIRWGVDAPHRTRHGVKADHANTWRAGIERLLLGYAMTGGGRTLFRGILPYDPLEGSQTVTLGGFLEFLRRLFDFSERMERPMTLSQWADVLMEILDHTIEPDPSTEREILGIRRQLRSLVTLEESSEYHEPAGIEVIRSILRDAFESEGSAAGFLSGGVTFCAMLPMRSIPFRVIWLAGMNDEAFPRRERMLGFDLMRESPRKGDRSQRSDDRYLFLEALLSARDRFIISFVGQSLRDNSPLPPSVVVSELLDVVAKGFERPDGSLPDVLVTRHPLQPFSPRQFSGKGDAGCFSYSRANCEAAAILRSERARPDPKFPGVLPEPEPEWREVSVGRLVQFFSNPSQFFLEKRLKVKLTSPDQVPEDLETFTLAGLDRYRLSGSLLSRKTAGGGQPEDLASSVRAAGELPHGTVGMCTFDQLDRHVTAFYERIAPRLIEGVLPPVDAALDLGTFRLSGRIDRRTPRGLLHYRPGRIRAKDRLELWIQHLVAHFSPEGPPPVSLILGLQTTLQYNRVPDAEVCLAALLDLYWQGLTAPLPFFPESSLAFAAAIVQQGKTDRDGLKSARAEWTPNAVLGLPREGEDPHMELCFRNRDPFAPPFQETALAVFGPLLSHEQKLD